jgi:type IV secretory pathway TrbL component
VIRYTPQDWFELGLKISGLTFVGCVGYLFYDWKREKGDKWAEEVERKVKNALKKIYKR